MNWEDFAGAAFTGAFDPSVDPYLVWADASGFADLARRGRAPDVVPVLLELAQGRSVQALRDWLQGSARVRPSGDSPFCTSEFTAAQCRGAVDSRVIKRFQICMPVVPERPQPREPRPIADRPNARAKPEPGTRLLLGVIDTGCPFAHRNFRNAGGTRILGIWDQDPSPAFAGVAGAGKPVGFGYGCEIDRRGLNRLIASATHDGAVDEDACYEAAGLRELRRRATHGAHVLDQFAGPVPQGERMDEDAQNPATWRRAEDDASRADIVFVQLPRDALQDSSAQGLAVHLLDGLRYIVSRADPKAKVVVNISYATATGPRDGSSLIEAAIDDLLARESRLTVVLAAGNDYAQRGHAGFGIAAGQPRELKLMVPAGSEAATLVEFWVPVGSDVRVQVTPPGAKPGTVHGGTKVLRSAGSAGGVAAVLTGGARGSRGDRQLFLLAIAPTWVQGVHRVPAPSGAWRIELSSDAGVEDGMADAYIARSKTELGMTSRARQAFWLDPAYDPERYLRSRRRDDDGLPSVVRRMGTLSGLATGAAPKVVAGYRYSDGAHAGYSSAGSTRAHGRLPDVALVSEEAPSLAGIRGAGSRSGCVVRLAGTSFSAPQHARALATLPGGDGSGPLRRQAIARGEKSVALVGHAGKAVDRVRPR